MHRDEDETVHVQAETEGSDLAITFLALKDPPEDSPVLRRMRRKSKRTLSGSNKLNQKVTFHERIRSSGYGPSRLPRRKKAGLERKTGVKTDFMNVHEYPMPINRAQLSEELQSALTEQHGSLLSLKCSVDGSFMASNCSGGIVRVFRMPLSKYKGSSKCFNSSGEWNSVDFSISRNLVPGCTDPCILTASAGEAYIWTTRLAEPLVKFPGQNDDNSNNPKGMSKAQFFFLDKFVLVSSGPELKLFHYEVEKDIFAPSSSMSRLQAKNELRSSIKKAGGSRNQEMVASWNFIDACEILDFAAINSFASNLAVVSRSDSTISVFDVANEKEVAVCCNGNRAAHTIALPDSAVSAGQSQTDMFLSSSKEDGGTIKLWDLRTASMVRSFVGHENRTHKVGMSLSPCMRFIATGSEDCSHFIFDIRATEPMHKHRDGYREAVSDVEYHPRRPFLMTSCFDGKINIFQS